MRLKRQLLYDFLEKRLLSGALITSKKNSALLMAYFLRVAVEVRDWGFLDHTCGDILLVHLSLMDLYNEVLFCSRLAFVILIAWDRPIRMKLVSRVVIRLLSNVLDIKQDLQGNPSRIIKKQKNSFLPKKAIARMARKASDFNTIRLLGEYLLQVGLYLQKGGFDLAGHINVDELVRLCSDVRDLEHKRELKLIWSQVIKLWSGFQRQSEVRPATWQEPGPEEDQNVQFEKIEKYVKRSISRNKKQNVEFQVGKEAKMDSQVEETNAQTADQNELATILTDLVYEGSAQRQKPKSFKIRRLSNFKAKKQYQTRRRTNPKDEDLVRVNDLMKQTGKYRRGRMFLKKRSGKGGGYVKGRVNRRPGHQNQEQVHVGAGAEKEETLQGADSKRQDSVQTGQKEERAQGTEVHIHRRATRNTAKGEFCQKSEISEWHAGDG